MDSEYHITKVDVTAEDKTALVTHIDEIKRILDQYPYSMDMKRNFVTTMSRAKSTAADLQKQINMLDVKN